MMISFGTLIILLLIIGLTFYLVVLKSLFLTPQESYIESEDHSADFNESLAILESLSELEVDYQMGKITAEDYEALKIDFQKNYLEAREKEN